mmetsp:Transcript_20582/g.25240  ORF Transcript_20582/g.25240 Transcript_20582/m.25240 type:complete len:120 (-) Transcript_20582:829-1188(-)
MFEQLKGKHFTCDLDNLYISTKFCCAALTEISQQIMTHGVCRTSGCRLPTCIIMQEKKTDGDKAAARGQVKVAVLKDNRQVSGKFVHISIFLYFINILIALCLISCTVERHGCILCVQY